MKTLLLTLCLAGTLGAAPVPGAALPQSPQAGAQQHARPARVQAIGTVQGVDRDQGTITLQHEAIPALGWPAMTMPFHATPAALKQAEVGTKVRFTLRPGDSGNLVTALEPVGR